MSEETGYFYQDEEKTLWDKRVPHNDGIFKIVDAFKCEDVKEFIKKLKEELHSAMHMRYTTTEEVKLLARVWNKIDKLAGENLIEK